MYTLQKSTFIVTSNAVPSPYLADCKPWESFCEEDLQDHYKNIHALFSSRVEELVNTQKPLSDNEEKEIRFMLDALLQVRRTIE